MASSAISQFCVDCVWCLFCVCVPLVLLSLFDLCLLNCLWLWLSCIQNVLFWICLCRFLFFVAFAFPLLLPWPLSAEIHSSSTMAMDVFVCCGWELFEGGLHSHSTCHLSPVACHLSSLTCHVSRVAYHLCPVHITCIWIFEEQCLLYRCRKWSLQLRGTQEGRPISSSCVSMCRFATQVMCTPILCW